MKKILLPVDFSDVTTRQVDEAEKLAKKFGAQVKILHIEVPVVIPAGYPGAGPAVVDHIQPNTEFDEKQLTALESTLARSGIDVSQEVAEGDPADHILNKAEEWGADYIILGSHGHGGLYNLFLGSVSQAVVHKAKCPLIIVPSKK
ncbi:universal stress protein [Spirochaeta cellobiosiphila]|uniref:universal stress protein n=1 Tax=Spirochaeta cellobiosiphila TaxID=504483 RepID=UPI00042157FF|nr:universal stress protein [Spirochaeta cellobiosiphila]